MTASRSFLALSRDVERRLMHAFAHIMSLGLAHERLDDTEIVLGAARSIHPGMVELDTYEAWIAVKRYAYPEALRILRSLDARSPGWMMGKAMLALCEFSQKDPAWRRHAEEVVNDGSVPDACALVRIFLEPEQSVKDYEAAQEAERDAAARALSEPRVFQSRFLRA